MLKIKATLFIVMVLFTAICFNACNTINSNNPEIQKPIFEPSNPYAAVDKSPMDISYYPVDFPALKMSGNDTSSLTARVIYSRPQKNGRAIFGNGPPPKYVQQYGALWRLGANEASEIEFFKPVNIKGQRISKGRYIIYCIPFEDKWVIVFNTNLFSWGLHPDTTKDIAKIEIPVYKSEKNIELFTMVFQPSAKGANLIMAWDNVQAALPISF
jgi:Protein of unknown function (DUF2911)